MKKNNSKTLKQFMKIFKYTTLFLFRLERIKKYYLFEEIYY